MYGASKQELASNLELILVNHQDLVLLAQEF